MLSDVEHQLHDEEERRWLKEDYHSLDGDIIVAGRLALAAGGPAKPSTFQLFQGLYVPFFDDEDDVCNTVDWSFFGCCAFPHPLTQDLRKRMNKLVLDLNILIREAVDEYKPYGVFWVDSYIDQFKDHRFCSPTGLGHNADIFYHDGEVQDYGNRTWFWSIMSPYEDGYEGTPGYRESDSQSAPNISQITFEHLQIDEEDQQRMADGTP
jgi:hypothetical protein